MVLSGLQSRNKLKITHLLYLVLCLTRDYGMTYLSLRACIGLWTAFLCIVLVATDASSLVCYITRFTEEAFAALICIIFIYEALEKLLHLRENYPINTHIDLDNLTLYRYAYTALSALYNRVVAVKCVMS